MYKAIDYLIKLGKKYKHPPSHPLRLRVDLKKAIEDGRVEPCDVNKVVKTYLDTFPDAEEILDRALSYVAADELIGICLACGEEYDSNLEPDAREVTCEACGEDRVYGSQEILFMLGV